MNNNRKCSGSNKVAQNARSFYTPFKKCISNKPFRKFKQYVITHETSDVLKTENLLFNYKYKFLLNSNNGGKMLISNADLKLLHNLSNHECTKLIKIYHGRD